MNHVPLTQISTGSPPYYGWLMFAGIAISLGFWTRLARRDDRLLLVYLGALLGAFLGGKVVYVLAEGWRDFGEPDAWPRLATGKTLLGALLGGYAAVELAKKLVAYPRATGDWFAMLVPAGIILGRVGCLLHGCCLGSVCEHSEWWTLNDRFGNPRWPAVPVEIGFNVAAILFFWMLRCQGRLAGQLFHLYLIAYGLFRFAHEFWRATPRVFGPFTGYHLAALAVAGLGLAGFVKRRRQRQLMAVPAAAFSCN